MGLRLPQRAVLLDNDGSYVLTTNEEGLVNVVRVVLGEQLNGDVSIESGLQTGDVVIVDGVQKAKPGMPATVSLMEAAQ
jgi:membrane fusion protein (multidrug efflux system)